MQTRNDLLLLAKKMVDEFHLELVIGTNEFIPFAWDLVEQHGIPLSKQSLVKYESELKRLCQSMTKEVVSDGFNDDNLEKFIEEHREKRNLKFTVYFYDDGTYEVQKPQRSEVKIPEYSMFAEGEDGYIVLKGTNRGKLVHQIDELAGWVGCAKGWAKWCLSNDKNLTDGDRLVFQKIIDGKI